MPFHALASSVTSQLFYLIAFPLVDHARTNVAVRVTFNVGSYTQACVCQLHGYTWYKPIFNMTTTSLMLKGCGKIFQYKDNHCMIVWGTRPHGRVSRFHHPLLHGYWTTWLGVSRVSYHERALVFELLVDRGRTNISCFIVTQYCCVLFC